MKRTHRSNRPRRGIALLLVMISLVVCSILTAGFLSSQGTSIGIARNERDAEKARGIAQSGLELSYWIIKNRSDWRTAMAPGTWLNNYAIGDGTVTVVAASADGKTSFANDTTQAAILTSTGTYAGRTFTLTATIGPTGGGTVFRGGNFIVGRIIMGSSDSSGSTLIDSYNSAVGAYSLSRGYNAVFNSGSANDYALIVFASSDFGGSFSAGSEADLSDSVYSTYWWNGPSSVSKASEPFVPGAILTPNLTGLVERGTLSKSLGTSSLANVGNYDSFTLNGSAPWCILNITASGTYRVKGNMTLNNFSILNVATGVNAVFVVDGNLSVSGSSAIRTTGSGTLNMFVRGSVTVQGSTAVNATNSPNNFTLFSTGENTISLSNSATVTGAIYAPTAPVNMSSTAQLYGALSAKSLTMSQSAAFHFDENLKNKRIDNLTGGSAPSGTALYKIAIVGSSQVVAR